MVGAHPSRAIYTITVQTSSVTVPAGVFNHTNGGVQDVGTSIGSIYSTAKVHNIVYMLLASGFSFKFHQKRFLYSLEIHPAFMCWAVKKLNEKPF